MALVQNQDLKMKDEFLSTGCSKLDDFLRGGIPKKGITQIFGEAGIGKTQLALQLCLAAQIPVVNPTETGGAAYICTESAFPSTRLNELLIKSEIAQKYPVSNQKIFIEHVSSSEDLESCIFNSERLPYLLTRNKIKLLIIDSIAATYRVEYESNNLKNRAKSLRSVGYQLQKLANIHQMAIICINQVSASLNSNFLEQKFTNEQPSLGITWANMVTNSFYMYKKFNQRYLHVAGSSYLPSKTIEFIILESGVKAI